MNQTSKVILFVCLAGVVACAADEESEVVEPPDIVEVFACSDYCPGPEDNYIKRVYDGVTDEEECRKLGGHPYTVTGWKTRMICEVVD
jgi:hypothetical protein